MNSELKELIFSPMLKANNSVRYSCVHMHEPETLDHHIFDISMLSYMIAKRFKYYGEDIDLGKVLELALVHDLEETITGDVPRNTKYALPECKKAMNEIGLMTIKRLADENEGFEDLPDLWSNAKVGKEGAIIKLADMICVLRKSFIEIEMYGNKEALKVTLELVSHIKNTLKSFQDTPVYGENANNYVITILNQSLGMLDAMNSKYYETIKMFNIDKMLMEDKY